MTEYNTNLSLAETERLVKLAEEAAEVIQAVAKILVHGFEATHAKIGMVPNRRVLERELGDLIMWMTMMHDRNDIKFENVDRAAMVKFMKAHRYVHHQWLENETVDREAALTRFAVLASGQGVALEDDPPDIDDYEADLAERKELRILELTHGDPFFALQVDVLAAHVADAHSFPEPMPDMLCGNQNSGVENAKS